MTRKIDIIPAEQLVRGMVDCGDISDDTRAIVLALLAIGEKLEDLSALWLIAPDEELPEAEG